MGANDQPEETGGIGMILSHSSRELFIKCRKAFYLNRIKRIRTKGEMLALPVKLGIIWDQYVQSRFNQQKFQDTFWKLADEYQLDDVSVSKIYGIIQAHRMLEIDPDYENEDGERFIGCQKRFELQYDGYRVVGYIDREYTDHVVETKFTARPDFYFQIHNITSQIGSYFLSNENYKYAIIEAVRVPDIKTGKRKYADEDLDSYRNRVKGEILSKPSHYFVGFDRDKGTYGKKFWRNEFDLESLEQVYQEVWNEIKQCLEANSEAKWWQNRKACYCPAPCEYLPICDTGVVSEEIFNIGEELNLNIEQELVEDNKTEGGEV